MEKTLNIKGKIWKAGKGSYVLTVPKSFIDSGLFKEGEEIEAKVPLNLDWGKKAKSLKESVKSEQQDGSVAQPGYILSTYDLHTTEALPYMQQEVDQHIRGAFEPQEAFLFGMA